MTTDLRNILLATTLLVGFGVAAAGDTAAAYKQNYIGKMSVRPNAAASSIGRPRNPSVGAKAPLWHKQGPAPFSKKGGYRSPTCIRGVGPGPGGANLFFENCWWYARSCTGGPTQYACQSCPDLPGRSCPAGTTSYR